VALFKIYLIYWKIKGSENAIKSGKGDRGLPEPMGIQPVHIPDIMPFSHLQVAEDVFLFLNSHWHTEQHLYCLLTAAAPTGQIPSTSLYK
jgi:hypothetical protein